MGSKKPKTIEKAMEVTGGFHLNQIRKEKRGGKISEVSGALNTNDNVQAERVSGHDRELAELKVKLQQQEARLNKIENKRKDGNHNQGGSQSMNTAHEKNNLNQSNIYRRYVSATSEDKNELDKTNLAALDTTIDEFNAIEEKEKVKRLQKFMSDKKRYKESGN